MSRNCGEAIRTGVGLPGTRRIPAWTFNRLQYAVMDGNKISVCSNFVIFSFVDKFLPPPHIFLSPLTNRRIWSGTNGVCSKGRRGDVGDQASTTLLVAPLAGGVYSLVILSVCMSYQMVKLLITWQAQPWRKALRFAIESHNGCGTIKLGNHFCDEVIDHVTSSTLKKAWRLKVESRFFFRNVSFFCMSY